MKTLKAAWQRLLGKRQQYRPGDLYRAHRQPFDPSASSGQANAQDAQWQPVTPKGWAVAQPGDALNISLRYGFDCVAWGRW